MCLMVATFRRKVVALTLPSWRPSSSQDGSGMILNVAHSAGPGQHLSPPRARWATIAIQFGFQTETEAAPIRQIFRYGRLSLNK